MHNRLSHWRPAPTRAFVIGLMLLSRFATPSFALAQTAKAMLLLRPHCEDSSSGGSQASVGDFATFIQAGVGSCRNFTVRDPKTQETPVLQTGNTLDMYLVLYNPDRDKIHHVRSWLSYDSQILEGSLITIGDSFSVPTPGEEDFAPGDGLVKLSASAEEGKEPSEQLIVIARVQFHVLRSPIGGRTPLSFYDVQSSLLGHTFASNKTGQQETNALGADVPSLMVLTEEVQTHTGANSSASDADVSSSSASEEVNASSNSSSEQRTAFVLLQVQNVRVGTEGSSVSVAWDAFHSSELGGYNVYWSTQAGRYIHRHSLGSDATSFILRGLPTGTVYYFAVRGFDTQNEESAFSQEVAVKVGDPSTSTSPLPMQPGQDMGPHGQNPLQGNVGGARVPGQAGLPTGMLFFLVCSATAGMFFAFRRQWIALRTHQSSSR
ncbi:fibronectin type III domain-containing protein [Candidatus Peregrinibacteria bacterium]|nr:fibronectin type III domain-containing protein [Candidatus Peregrinibacteria bacterium]